VPAETHTNQGPLDRNGVFALIRDQLADILEADPSTITKGHRLWRIRRGLTALIELWRIEKNWGTDRWFRIDDETLKTYAPFATPLTTSTPNSSG